MNKKLSQKYFDVSFILLEGIGFFIVGILLIIYRGLIFQFLSYSIFMLFSGFALIQALKNMFERSKKEAIENTVDFFTYFLIGLLIYIFRNSISGIFPILFAVYALIESIIKLIIYYLYSRDNIKNKNVALIRAIIPLTFAIIILLIPDVRESVVFSTSGIYFILISMTYFSEVINSLLSKKKIAKFKSNFKFTMPVLIAAFIPRKVVKNINNFFEAGYIKKRHKIEKENSEYDLEVLVHLAINKKANFGHVDIFFDDRVISYGSYDEAKVVLSSAIGDGVLFEVEKEKYLKFCNETTKKLIVGYGIKLNEDQKEAVRNKIKEIKSKTYEWFPKSYHEKNESKDYASKLYNATGAKFYKFNSGKFKTYFVLNTNCVKLADEILGKCGINIIKISGIITPGAYYDYFDREFGFKKSNVVSKTIYMWE